MPTKILVPREKIPDFHLRSYVKLDMAFGVGAGATLFDKSRYRSHGAITTATWAAGLHGYCLDFVAANPDLITIPTAHTQLDFTSEDFSIIARINGDSFVAHNYLLTRGAFNARGYRFVVLAGGSLAFGTWQVAAGQLSTSLGGVIVAGNWYTVGMSRSGASVRVYRNGVDVTNTVGVHINPVTSPDDAYIGIHPDGASNPFDGRMEFLRVFGGVALTTSEHLAYHNALA